VPEGVAEAGGRGRSDYQCRASWPFAGKDTLKGNETLTLSIHDWPAMWRALRCKTPLSAQGSRGARARVNDTENQLLLKLRPLRRPMQVPRVRSSRRCLKYVPPL